MSEQLDQQWGLSLRQDLSLVLRKAGLDLEEHVTGKNILCIDVGEGAEITAFKDLKPNIFIAAESPRQHYNFDEQDPKELLDKKISGTSVDLRRLSPLQALSAAENEGTKFDLITWLNMYPDDYENAIHQGTVARFIEIAQSKCLSDNGVIVVSIAEPESVELERLKHIQELLPDNLKSKSQILDFKVDKNQTNIPLSAAGSYALILKK